jgi:hypothetical protein
MELELKIIKMTTTFDIFVPKGKKKKKKSKVKNKKTREEKDIKRKKR